MKLDVALLPGDGIGPEVTAEAMKALNTVAAKFGHEVESREYPIGGIALDSVGQPLPEATLDGCLAAKAVLLGAVGGPRYDKNPRGLKPEDGLLALRRGLGAFANLRPVHVYDELVGSSPLRPGSIRGCDMLIVRELLGGLYFGEPRGFDGNGNRRAFNTMIYSADEIERVTRVAFDAARTRRKKVTSVEKSNVLEVCQLWREVVTVIAAEYPDVELEHALVDSCAMQLIRDPRRFDVVLTENMFGDILSDEAAVIAGSIGLLPSASLGGPVGLYEPIHGSAPDIANQGKANPIGTILSVAMMLRHTFGLEPEAQTVETAVKDVLADGLRTADLSDCGPTVTTQQMGDAICRAIKKIDL